MVMLMVRKVAQLTQIYMNSVSGRWFSTFNDQKGRTRRQCRPSAPV